MSVPQKWAGLTQSVKVTVDEERLRNCETKEIEWLNAMWEAGPEKGH